ncbi:hypothetical protein PYJP_17400 [Pyrofollis japonicus]|uniref:TrmO family methyltransferase domain-containing protein n=1 Tax=Pyrofollis japonicus TaxID=3060460 RepID=UPI00295A6B4A|nr:TrmO family methyltransferase [Pyrofollis japonicus]BEP18388.1 hypothetical protein PYJP_17400 [Pyrofollis japonicus]
MPTVGTSIRGLGELCCKPIGRVVRDEPVPEQVPRGREAVIAYGEELMKRRARIVLEKEYCEGLRGARKGMLLWVIWVADRAPGGEDAPITVRPFMDEALPVTGVFLTRSPARPCPLGLSLVYVEDVEECSLVVRGIDAYHNTPVLDIKVYSHGLDSPQEVMRRARSGEELAETAR